MKTGEYLAYWLGTIWSQINKEKLVEHFQKHITELKHKKHIDRKWLASMKNLLQIAEIFAERNVTVDVVGKITQEEQLTRLFVHHIQHPETTVAPPEAFNTKSREFQREKKELEKRLGRRSKKGYVHHNEADSRTIS
jgi:hypothetical protein